MEVIAIFDASKAYIFLGVFLAVVLLVVFAILVDLWDGVQTARVTGQRVHSHKLRVTMAKMSEYFRFVVIGFLIDCVGMLFSFYVMPFVVILFGIGLILVEVKSMLEHARRRKSRTTELPAIIQAILDCRHEKDAHIIIEQLNKSKIEINEIESKNKGEDKRV
ncbi:MAG: phage holin family protein [Muribaculaceae bacterium]|nr:phage holin family protein [Muribaculaceae bacterium]